MKTTIKTIALLASVFLASCTDDFLNTDVDQYLTKERKDELVKESPEAVVKLVQGSLDGVYNVLIDYNLNGNTSHDYFGLKAIHLATDLTSEDMVQVKHHWFGFDYNFDNNAATYRRTRLMWAMNYKIISSCNTILADYFSVEATDPKLLALKGEVLALRSIAYYYLVNLYQQTYTSNPNALGVPLVLKPSDEKLPRATVKEVYDRIIADLRFAVEKGVITDNKKDADKRVAASFLAKAYACEEKWDSVAFYADIAIKDVPLMDANTYQNNFVTIANTEWLWGFDINATTSTLYASFYSHMDNTIDGYCSLGVYKSIHNKLYDKIDAGDIRKKLFVNKIDNPAIAAAYPALPDYASLKYVSPADFSGDYCFIRVADPYLLLAEAQVELNKIAEAKTTLSDLISMRFAGYSPAAADQASLREEIRTQRRIELWGEGTAFFDFKRWKIGVDRTVAGTNHRTKIKVDAGDKKFVYMIPQGEIDANPNIVQNP